MKKKEEKKDNPKPKKNKKHPKALEVNQNIDQELTESDKLEEKYPVEDVRIIFDFQFDSVKETALVLAKGITYYLTIIAGLSWFIFTRENSIEDIKMQFYAVCLATWISIITLGAAIVITYGLWKGLGSIKRLLKMNNEALFTAVKLYSFINKGRFVVIGVLAFCIFVLISFYKAISMLFPGKSFGDFLSWSYCI